MDDIKPRRSADYTNPEDQMETAAQYSRHAYMLCREDFRRACRHAGHGGDLDALRVAHGHLLTAVTDLLGSGPGAKVENDDAFCYLRDIADNGSPRVPGFDRDEWRRVSRMYRMACGPLGQTNPSAVMTSEAATYYGSREADA